MTDDQIRREIWHGKWASWGKEPEDRDYAYWGPMWNDLIARGVEINHPGYAMDRLLGWQAEGADVPPFGNWAQPPTPYHDVPPYPGDAVDPPVSIPDPPAVPDDRLSAIERELGEIKKMVFVLGQKEPPDYETHLPIHAYVSSLDIILKPKV